MKPLSKHQLQAIVTAAGDYRRMAYPYFIHRLRVFISLAPDTSLLEVDAAQHTIGRVVHVQGKQHVTLSEFETAKLLNQRVPDDIVTIDGR